MRTWEHKKMEVQSMSVAVTTERMGALGWQLAAAYPKPTSDVKIVLFFKREITGK